MQNEFLGWSLSVLISVSYVACLYSFVPENLKGLERDNQDVIRFRLRRVGLVCSVWILLIPNMLVQFGMYSSKYEALQNIGMLPGFTKSQSFLEDIASLFEYTFLFFWLFMGPICEYIRQLLTREADLINDIKETFFSLKGFRNHIFGPVTEELVFRSIILTLLTPYGVKKSHILLSPLLFGIAHIHHAYNLYKYEHHSRKEMILTTAFLTLYTSIFGILCNHLFLSKNHNTAIVIVFHIICNVNGFPDLTVGHGIWNVIYRCLLVIGLVGFISYL